MLKTISFNKLRNVIPEQKVLSYRNEKLFFSNYEDDWIKNKISSSGNIKINSITIDELILKFNLDKINYLKCNIEGSEIELLNIERENLKKIENICIECHDFLNINTFNYLVNFLYKHNFKIHSNYKKSQTHPHLNFYVYASRNTNNEKSDYFSLRDKNDYISFNRIIKKKIIEN